MHQTPSTLPLPILPGIAFLEGVDQRSDCANCAIPILELHHPLVQANP